MGDISKTVQRFSKFVNRFGVLQGIKLFYQVYFSSNSKLHVEDPNLGIEFQTRNDESQKYHLLGSYDDISNQVNSIPSDSVDNVLDLGANIGIFTLLMKRKFPECSIRAVEPSKQVLPILKENCGKLEDVGVIPYAIAGSSEKNRSFYLSPNSNQVSSLSESAASLDGVRDISEVSIETKTLNQLVNDWGTVDVLKIDIQGLEHAALSSTPDVLNDVDILIVEASFLHSDVQGILNLGTKYFDGYEVISDTRFGADLLFYS